MARLRTTLGALLLASACAAVVSYAATALGLLVAYGLTDAGRDAPFAAYLARVGWDRGRFGLNAQFGVLQACVVALLVVPLGERNYGRAVRRFAWLPALFSLLCGLGVIAVVQFQDPSRASHPDNALRVALSAALLLLSGSLVGVVAASASVWIVRRDAGRAAVAVPRGSFFWPAAAVLVVSAVLARLGQLATHLLAPPPSHLFLPVLVEAFAKPYAGTLALGASNLLVALWPVATLFTRGEEDYGPGLWTGVWMMTVGTFVQICLVGPFVLGALGAAASPAHLLFLGLAVLLNGGLVGAAAGWAAVWALRRAPSIPGASGRWEEPGTGAEEAEPASRPPPRPSRADRRQVNKVETSLLLVWFVVPFLSAGLSLLSMVIVFHAVGPGPGRAVSLGDVLRNPGEGVMKTYTFGLLTALAAAGTVIAGNVTRVALGVYRGGCVGALGALTLLALFGGTPMGRSPQRPAGRARRRGRGRLGPGSGNRRPC
jgi:hypothetical protein